MYQAQPFTNWILTVSLKTMKPVFCSSSDGAHERKIKYPADILSRRKIRIIEGNAKCCHLKKYLLVTGLCGRCLSIYEAQNRIPPPPPVTNSIRVTVYLSTQGWGEGELEPERRGISSQSSVEYQHD
jgi:hypothetical protein